VKKREKRDKNKDDNQVPFLNQKENSERIMRKENACRTSSSEARDEMRKEKRRRRKRNRFASFP
jgi:hypothetical protein